VKGCRVLYVALLLALCCATASAEIVKLPVDTNGGMPPQEACYLAENLYEDESIRVEIEQHNVESTRCYVARVRIADPSQLRTASAYGFERPQTEMTRTIARRVQAVVAINGDYYSYSSRGYMVRQGKTYIDKPYGDRDVLLIDENGDFFIQKKADKDTLEKYRQMPIVNSFNFGPGLVVDGEVLTGYGKEFNSGDKRSQRSCIAQVRRGELEYLLISCEGPMESPNGGLTMDEFAAFVASLGVENAYNLDGGNSASMIFKGKKLNAVRNKHERPISDIVYFASASAGE